LSRNRKDEREINKTQRRGGGSDTQQLERELGADIRAVMGGRAVVPPVRSSYEESGGRVPPRHGAEEPMRGQENRRGVPEAPDDPEAVRAARKKRRKRNSVYYAVTYFFVLIFLALIGYMVYFNLRLRDDVMRSPYNKRQDAQAKYTTRGRIETIDGTVVAKTERDGEGKDYRVYPEARVYAHVVGFDTHGKSGIENIATVSQTVASRDYSYHQISCRKGDEIALLDGEIVSVGSDYIKTILDAIAAIEDIDEKETCVIFRGTGVDEDRGEELCESLSARYPLMDFECINGGQEIYHWIIGLA